MYVIWFVKHFVYTMKTTPILAMVAIIFAVGALASLTMISMPQQQVHAFSGEQYCQHAYHFFGGGVGPSGCRPK